MKHPITPHAQFAHAPLLPLLTAYLMMQPLSTDLYLASLPALAAYFGVGPAAVQLTLSLFVIGFGAAQLLAGPLSDRFGRRPVLLGGLAVYAGASLLCLLAPSMPVLVGGRFLQAMGCCATVTMGRTIVRDAWLAEHGTPVIARAASFMSLAPLLGPILGTYLQVAFGWRAAFAALTLFSLALLAMSWLRLPETNQHKDPQATRLAGLLGNYRLVLGAREFWIYALPGALMYGGLFAFISGISFALIEVLGVPTSWFGFCYALGISGYLSGTLVCRRLLPRLGTVGVLRLGGATALGAGLVFVLAVLGGMAPAPLVIGVMFLTMGSQGMIYPVSQASAVAPFPRQAGTAAGLMGALTMLVASAVGTVIGATHDGTLLPLALIVATLGLMIFGATRIATAGAAVAAKAS